MKKHELEAKLTEYLKTLTDKTYQVRLHKVEPIKKGFINQFIKECETHFNYFEGSIVSSWRKSELVRVRHSIFYILYNEFGIVYDNIGVILNKDHSTVLNGANKVQDSIDKPKTNIDLYNTYNQVYAIYQKLI